MKQNLILQIRQTKSKTNYISSISLLKLKKTQKNTHPPIINDFPHPKPACAADLGEKILDIVDLYFALDGLV